MAVRFVSVGREPLSLRKEDGCISKSRILNAYREQLVKIQQ